MNNNVYSIEYVKEYFKKFILSKVIFQLPAKCLADKLFVRDPPITSWDSSSLILSGQD